MGYGQGWGAADDPPRLWQSMDGNGIHIVLPRQHKGKPAVAHQREPFTVSRVQCIQCFAAHGLLAHVLGKVRHIHGPDINDCTALGGAEIVFGLHITYPLLILIFCTTGSGRARVRSTCSRPFSMIASPTSTPSAKTKLR